MSRLTKRLAATCFAITLMGGFGMTVRPASAGDSCYEPVCVYKTVTVWVTKQVPYTKKLTLYKPCGTPYHVWKIYYQSVKVPVTHRIKECH